MNARRNIGTVVDLLVIAAGIVIIAATLRPGGPVVEWWQNWREGVEARELALEEWDSLSQGPRIDNGRGPVKMVEFGDFECPYCRSMHALIKRLLAEHPAIGVVYRHSPRTASHPSAAAAAAAAICAEEQGRFISMYDRLYETTDWRLDQNWRREAVAAGVPDLAEFEACLEHPDTQSRIRDERSLGDRLNSRGVPMFVFESGEVWSGTMTEEQMRSHLGIE